MGGMRRRWALTGSSLSSALARWTQPGFVVGVQRGTILITAGGTSNTATITAVDVNNARLRSLSFALSVSVDTENKLLTKIALTNGTTITANLNTAGLANTTSSYEVSAYAPGVIKQVQRGTVAAAGTATITTLNTLKAELDYLGCTTTNTNSNIVNICDIVQTNATTISCTSLNGTGTAGYQSLEFN